jgi:hypothetical protein
VSGAGEGHDIRVRVTARARADEIVGFRDGVLHVRVAAVPADGRANDAICRLIAARTGVPPSAVSVIRGASSRLKTVRVAAASAAVARRLQDA